jgi:hypothetical protein
VLEAAGAQRLTPYAPILGCALGLFWYLLTVPEGPLLLRGDPWLKAGLAACGAGVALLRVIVRLDADN